MPKPTTKSARPSQPEAKTTSASTVRLSYLDARGGFLPVSLPNQSELAGAPKIVFGKHGAPEVMTVKAGGKLVVEYHPERSPIQHKLGTVPAWGVTAFIEFQPSGKRIEAPAVAFKNQHGGQVSAEPLAVPIAVDVPKGTTAVSMWFRQFQGATQPAEAWDSNFGRNYNLEVK